MLGPIKAEQWTYKGVSVGVVCTVDDVLDEPAGTVTLAGSGKTAGPPDYIRTDHDIIARVFGKSYTSDRSF